jgi:DNA polymerase-4/DNA polymerase IV (DinB-like DNA polymerase)
MLIIHVDMDAFYASVEVRDNPALAGKPLKIGALPTERGVVATCSYEARKYGIHSAMNIKEAYRLCPNGIYMHGNFDKYRAVSAELHKIWNDYAAASEYIALDEAYLNVTETAVDVEKAREFAREIKRRVLEEQRLTCSVGLAYSKTAAKTASEEKKPNGYFEILTPEAFTALLAERNVKALYTVGAKTAEKLSQLGIFKVKDIQDKRDAVIQLLGKQGRMIVDLASGIDDRKVIPYRPEDAKSISRELTFQEDVADYDFLKHALLLLSISVERRARRVGLHGKGVVLKLTYANMKSITRSKILPEADHAITIYREAVKLLAHVQHDPVRLVGVGIYNLTGDEYEQLVLEGFEPEQAGNPENELETELRRLQSIYLLDFAGHLEQIYHGETLYKTIEYMRKKRR